MFLLLQGISNYEQPVNCYFLFLMCRIWDERFTQCQFLGPGEKHYKYVGFWYVIRVFFLVFFSTLTYLIRYVRVPTSQTITSLTLKTLINGTL